MVVVRTLNDLVRDPVDLEGFQARLTALPRPQVVQELLHRGNNFGMRTVLQRVQELLLQRGSGGGQGDFRTTALHWVVYRDPSPELVRAICDVMKDDPLKRNLFAITDAQDWYPLHWIAISTTRVEVLQFVIDRFPHALVRGNNYGRTPLAFATYANPHRANHAAIVRCLEDNTARYPALLNQLTVKCCMVRLKEQGMTVIVARTPHNEQTPSQFVYELLDMMVNSEMKAMAEDIISYVGTNVGLEEVHAMLTRSKKKAKTSKCNIL